MAIPNSLKKNSLKKINGPSLINVNFINFVKTYTVQGLLTLIIISLFSKSALQIEAFYLHCISNCPTGFFEKAQGLLHVGNIYVACSSIATCW